MVFRGFDGLGGPSYKAFAHLAKVLQKRQLGPRRKRMTRSARMRAAVSWLKQFSGKNVLRGYCKHYWCLRC